MKIRNGLGIRSALRLGWQSGPSSTLALVGLQVLLSILPLLVLYISKLFLDDLIDAQRSDNAAIHSPVIYICILASCMILFTLSRCTATLLTERQSHALANYMQGLVQKKSIELDLQFFDDPHYHDTFQRAQSEAPHRPARVVNDMYQIVQNIISLVGLLVFLFVTSGKVLIVVLLAAAVPAIYFRLKYANEMFRWRRDRTKTDRRINYFNWILTSELYAKEVRMFNLGQYFIDEGQRLREQIQHEELQLLSKRSKRELKTEVFAIVILFGSLAAMFTSAHGAINPGDLIIYFLAVYRGQEHLRQTFVAVAQLHEDNLFLSNVDEFLRLEPKIKESMTFLPVPKPLKKGIRFINVCFEYPNSQRKSLNNISLEIRPGEMVAVVGANGSGKTTLAKLLCRLYDPTEGSITLDGLDLRAFPIEEIRREISAIFQDYAKFHLTVHENIGLSDTSFLCDQDHLVRAARQASAHGFIMSLPRDYKTMLGKWFEAGEELSIGEWQKIAVARAFFRCSQVIIFDEPTSAIDSRSEVEIFNTLKRCRDGRTTVIVTHRLGLVSIVADRIIVLENGQIAEMGSHDKLLLQRGAYYKLFEKCPPRSSTL